MIFYQNIHLNLPKDVVKHIIGSKGKNFFEIAKKCNLASIWYNPDTCAIVLYGEKDHLDEARVYMYKVIEAYVKKYAPEMVNCTYNGNPLEESCTDICLDGLLENQNCKHVIGRGGKNFKQITRESSVSFIWYLESTNTIQVFGTKYNTMRAIKLLHEHINEVRRQIDLNDYSDEPALKKQKKN